MNKLINTTAVHSLQRLAEELLSANEPIACMLGFGSQKDEMMTDLKTRISDIFDDSLPKAWLDIMNASMARIKSGEQLHAIQVNDGSEVVSNDANGFNHYAPSIAFLDENGNEKLSVRVTFVEVRDISGWEMELSYDEETRHIKVDGVVVSKDDDAYVDTIETWGDLLLEIYHSNLHIFSYPTPDVKKIAYERTAERLAELQARFAEIPA